MIKKCVVCGKEFDGKANSKYCSEKCRETPVPIQKHVGEHHWKLTITSAYKKGKNIYAVCKCDCGNSCTVRYDCLISGNNKSCGCECKKMQIKPADLTGKVNCYGCVAIKQIGKDGVDYLWLCRCSCGNEFVARSYLFKKTKSCGCAVQKSRQKNASLAHEVLSNGVEQGTSVVAIMPGKKLLKNNTSGVTGVHWAKGKNKWVARIEFQGKNYYLGAFVDKSDAIAVRKEAEQAMFGNFLVWFREEFPDRWAVLEAARKKNRAKKAE